VSTSYNLIESSEWLSSDTLSEHISLYLSTVDIYIRDRFFQRLNLYDETLNDQITLGVGPMCRVCSAILSSA
jgi:hypothetical protein